MEATLAAGGAPPSATSRPRRRDAAALQRAWTLDPADLHAAERLGHGSQSDVLHGKWQGLRVAIKQPREAGAAGSEFVRREVRALSRVQHPNVVRLYGVCFEPQPRVVMAFAAGGALADQLATRQSSPLDDARLLRGIASGMASVHAHKVHSGHNTKAPHLHAHTYPALLLTSHRIPRSPPPLHGPCTGCIVRADLLPPHPRRSSTST